MDYGEVITSAWRIIWKHKVLWLFGILGSVGGSASSSNSGVSYQFSNPDFGLGNINPPTELQTSLIIGAGAVIIVLLILLAVFMSTIGRIGMTHGTLEADQGAETLTISGVYRGSLPFFWRVFFLNLIIFVGITMFAVLFTTFFVAASIVTLGLALICLLPLLCILVPVSWFVFVYIEQANAALVVEDLSIGAALQRGWQVFWNNLGTMILMGLFVAAIGVGAGFLLSLPVSISLFPVVGSILGGGELSNIGLVAAICLVVYLPILFVLNGIVRTYLGSVWTLTFLRLTARAEA